MIRYDLSCARAHAFDGWFRSSADYDAQAEKGLLACPVCGSAQVRKALMAPSLGGAAGASESAAPAPQEVALISEKEQALRAMLRAVRAQVTQNSENVGERFPEIARKMHAEEIAQRSIYGRATAEEAKALADEGIAVQPLPRFPDEGN